jgi:hypothetical protein
MRNPWIDHPYRRLLWKGNENWEFDEHGLMRLRLASINDSAISLDLFAVLFGGATDVRLGPWHNTTIPGTTMTMTMRRGMGTGTGVVTLME